MHRRFIAVLVTVALAATQSVWALGLGDIDTQSSLNEPMRAQISLLSASQEEVSTLEVRLASADTFARYGIEKPAFLNSLKFTVSGGNQPVITVSSTSPITEPFITMLVEAVWPRGRLLREYTIFLDPPTYASATQAAPAPVVRQAPAQRPSANTGAINRPAQRSTTNTSTANAAGVSANGDSYSVQRNDTLWEIAANIRPDNSVTMNQVMMAIYEANPQAFSGNINRLNAGASLRLPSQNDLFSIGQSAASAEVQRQNRDWRGTSSSAGSLRLLPPDNEPGTVSSSRDSASGSSAGATSTAELEAIRAQLAEKDRLVAIQNEELARLRARLSQIDAQAQTTTTDTSASDAAQDAVADTVVDATDEVFVDDSDPVEATDDTAAVDDAAVVEPVVEKPVVEKPKPAVVRSSKPEPSLIEKLTGSIWTLVGGAVVVLFGLLALLARRRKDDSDPTGTWESLDAAEIDDIDGTLAKTGRLRELSGDAGSIVVVEGSDGEPTGAFDPSAADLPEFEQTFAPSEPMKPVPDEEDTGYSMEDTFSSDTAINLDQSDPIAEADFHMAYGLYDQAADLIKGALKVDSGDPALKSKLCEIYFVWGNQDGFIEAAGELKATLEAGDPEWDKVVIMGQQIAPAHELFSGQVAEAGALDLSLDDDGGIGTLDVDFAGDGDKDPFDAVFDQTDVGEGTVEQSMPDIDASGIDFEMDDFLTDEGTVQQPMISDAIDPSDATAEINLDDLGLELNDLTETGGESLTTLQLPEDDISDDLLDMTGETHVLPDELRVDTSKSLQMPGDDDETNTSSTILTATKVQGFDDDMTATSQLPSLDEIKDFDSLAETGELPSISGSDIDLDVADLTNELNLDDIGFGDDATQQQPLIDNSSTVFSEAIFGDETDPTAETGLNATINEDSDSRTMTEVGTKLDLARAYVDMGDPEGARSILEEVMAEGDEGQRQEASQLLDGLNA